MDPFRRHTGTAVALRRSDVDTDQIIPSEYLKRVERTGFGEGLFRAWRGPGFPLDDPARAGASVLVTGENFGTGSSREHAVWALTDAGFRVVVSPRFADIFRGNAAKSGLLAVQLPADVVARLSDLADADPSLPVTVDLEERRVSAGDVDVAFDFDEHTRWRLLHGLDDVGLTLQHADDIDAFEAARPSHLPRTTSPA